MKNKLIFIGYIIVTLMSALPLLYFKGLRNFIRNGSDQTCVKEFHLLNYALIVLYFLICNLR